MVTEPFSRVASVTRDVRPLPLVGRAGAATGTCARSPLERTAGVFTTFPAFPSMPGAGFFDQVVGTGLLLLLIFAISDEFNLPPGANMAPLMIGLVVVAIGMSFGGMHGYPINPARDFGPRLFTALAGFRNNGLTDGSGAWLIPIAGPMLGGLLGAAVYDFGIRRFLRKSEWATGAAVRS